MKEIDIAATLEHIRDQRPGMVQTKVRPKLGILSLHISIHNARAEVAGTLTSPAVLLQDQFEFALTAVAEEVNAILKALPQ